jgi:hypothetical protein
MARYFVTWEMDIEADTPEAAALKALRIHRDPESVATVFKVAEIGKKPVYVDIVLDDDAAFYKATVFPVFPERYTMPQQPLNNL